MEFTTKKFEENLEVVLGGVLKALVIANNANDKKQYARLFHDLIGCDICDRFRSKLQEELHTALFHLSCELAKPRPVSELELFIDTFCYLSSYAYKGIPRFNSDALRAIKEE